MTFYFKRKQKQLVQTGGLIRRIKIGSLCQWSKSNSISHIVKKSTPYQL
uniref:Uncharacterized protein n=1 Tax=Rhizophora mucronata TaxID=61149 RepID=A0A2P2QM80_RHIMU